MDTSTNTTMTVSATGQQKQQQKQDSSSIRTTTTSTTTFHRYEQLWKLIQNGMKRSRQSVDTKQLIHTIYDEDAISVLGGNSDMLVNVLESMFDKVEGQVTDELQEYFMTVPSSQDQEQDQDQNHHLRMSIRQRLEFVEQMIEQIQKEDEMKQEIENHDYDTTQQVLNNTLLPPNVSWEDILRYQEYQQQVKEKEVLQSQLDSIQKDIHILRQEQNDMKVSVNDNVKQLQHVVTELESTANQFIRP